VLFMTGFAPPGEIAGALSHGDRLLTKPFRIRALTTHVAEMLGLSAPEATAPLPVAAPALPRHC
jgi:hypothetical protein